MIENEQFEHTKETMISKSQGRHCLEMVQEWPLRQGEVLMVEKQENHL